MPGVKIEDLEANLGDLLHKDSEKDFLYVGTNSAVGDSPEDIFSKLISIIDSVSRSLPKCSAFIRNLIKRKNNRKRTA